MITERPYPPERMLVGVDETFEPAEGVWDWIKETFIIEDAPLANEDHAHLMDADIGVLWTSCDNSRNMRMVIGQAEIMPPMAMGKWQRARAVQQIDEWFDGVPDFLITIAASPAASMDDASFCALVEHELYHCAQSKDQYGMPKFTKDGRPSFAIRGHDVEEFVGVVARYGVSASGVAEMIEAANRRPLIGLADIAGACGTCLKAAA